MIVANTPVPPVPDVILREEILFIHLPFGSIRRRMLARAPERGQIKAMIGMDHQPDRLFQVFEGDMALIDPGDVAAIHPVQRSGGLAGTQITAEAKHRGQIPCHSMLQFAVIAGNGTEEPGPVQPVLGMHQDFERRDRL